MSKTEINNINTADIDIKTVTPMLKQYLEIKRKYRDYIVMYRLGDFYEAFFEDAIAVSRALEITLTARDGGSLGKFPMAGIPAKAFQNYLPKFLENNLKTVICEQLENPAEAQGIVKRDVTEIITPGTLAQTDLIKSSNNNWLAAVCSGEGSFGLAYTDITTGEFFVTQGSLDVITSELAALSPAELLVPVKKQKILPFQIVPEDIFDLPETLTANYKCTKMQPASFDLNNSQKVLKNLFNVVSLDSFGLEDYKTGFRAAGAVAEYVISTRRNALPKFDAIKTYEISDYVSLSSSTVNNLELLCCMRDKKKFGSLLWTLDKVKTGFGGRLLKKVLMKPLKNAKQINERLDATQLLVDNPDTANALSDLLSKIYDIERLSVKLTNASILPREFLALKDSINVLPEIDSILRAFDNNLLKLDVNISELLDFADIIERTIDPETPSILKDGGVIKSGVNSELDYFRDLLNGGKQKLQQTEEFEKQRTGIKNLKVGYSKTFGYFIEVTNSNLSMVPPDYIRRQTLTNAERFITEDLKKFETEVSAAKFKVIETEYSIYSDLKEYSKEFASVLKKTAENLAMVDVLLAFATVSSESGYVRPIVDDSEKLVIKDGRHPVLEKILPMGSYISNDLVLPSENHTPEGAPFMILTGPNMAGKSTYMRQNALIIILAQIGCFVSASFAHVGIVDKIFTRVGASDDLTLGQSTFMVEMSETAYILNGATSKSFIVLDEIGRGTSTYDGVAIAWSVAEYIATQIKARTVFATHYHELNVMPQKFPQIKNFRITIAEHDGKIEFLRKVTEGAASKSYGIYVAKNAGLPSKVVSNAEKLMVAMQKEFSKNLSGRKKFNPLESAQLTLPV